MSSSVQTAKKLGDVFETVLNTKNAKCVKKNPQTQCRWAAVFSLCTVTDECRCAQRPVIKGNPPQKRKKSDVCHIRDCVRATRLICANKNIRNNQFVLVRTDLQFCVAQLNFKMILCAPHADQMLAAVLTCKCPGYSKKSTGGTRVGGFTLRMCKENEKLGDIIVQKSREQGGISG